MQNLLTLVQLAALSQAAELFFDGVQEIIDDDNQLDSTYTPPIDDFESANDTLSMDDRENYKRAVDESKANDDMTTTITSAPDVNGVTTQTVYQEP